MRDICGSTIKLNRNNVESSQGSSIITHAHHRPNRKIGAHVVVISYFSYIMILYRFIIISFIHYMDSESTPTPTAPKYVFIVPYRDREPHRVFFNTYIYKVMEDIPREDWMFYFVHQNDKRPFNRGAMKNIGF